MYNKVYFSNVREIKSVIEVSQLSVLTSLSATVWTHTKRLSSTDIRLTTYDYHAHIAYYVFVCTLTKKKTNICCCNFISNRWIHKYWLICFACFKQLRLKKTSYYVLIIKDLGIVFSLNLSFNERTDFIGKNTSRILNCISRSFYDFTYMKIWIYIYTLVVKVRSTLEYD